MARRKSVCLKWTLVLLVVLVCPSVYTRPQDPPVITTNSGQSEISTQNPLRNAATEPVSPVPEQPAQLASPASETSARDVKSKTPIRDSIEMVAIQLLDKPNVTIEAPIVSDTRIPPKLKTQVKHKIKTRNEDGENYENAHPGEAVPVTMEELDTENRITEVTHESSTSNEGISTWGSFSNSVKENTSTESTKIEDKEKKPKPAKNKPKRPQNNKISKRPIIGSTNKADLVAGGSAINENVYNKIKDTVLSNVQKNKNTSVRPSSTTTTTTTTTEAPTTKKESKAPVIPVVTVTSKPKKKNKNKPKSTTTLAPPLIDDSALLPTEAKEQEIELEVSTPPITTKKPKRKSNRKKNKTKKRKTTTPKPTTEVAIAEIKTSNKTKSNKIAKKPVAQTGAITTQIYNYLSREVMPSVGVGVLGLASLVGIAGYFLYPFATPVRRTFEVDKSDDLYRNNAEEYANDGNGQAEEDMLGTVLAGMPAHAKQKLNPYAAQTAHINRYPVRKEQDNRYRHVTPGYNPNYKVHYAQQKTGIAHAAVYSKPYVYGPQYETRHAYTTEGKYNYEKPKQPNYTQYSVAAVEPIYAAPQTGPSGLSAYGNDASNSVVYGVKPSSESDFKPVYPFEGQFVSETTSSSVTYPPTSIYLGSSSNESENQDEETKYEENSGISSEGADNKFVVGNVPKELSDSATPAVVPEHGPRKLRKRRSMPDSLKEFLNDVESNKDVFISNEIDDIYDPITTKNLSPSVTNDVPVISQDVTTSNNEPEPSTTTQASTTAKLEIEKSNPTTSTSSTTEKVDIVEAVTVRTSTTEAPTTKAFEVVESVSTIPISNSHSENLSEAEIPLDFPTNSTDSENNGVKDSSIFSLNSTSGAIEDVLDTTTKKPFISLLNPLIEATKEPEVVTYPPSSEGGIFSFLQKLIVFKLRLGLGLLQGTVDALNRLKNDTTTVWSSS